MTELDSRNQLIERGDTIRLPVGDEVVVIGFNHRYSASYVVTNAGLHRPAHVKIVKKYNVR